MNEENHSARRVAPYIAKPADARLHREAGRHDESRRRVVVDISIFQPRHGRLRYGEELLQRRAHTGERQSNSRDARRRTRSRRNGCGGTTGRDTDKAAKFDIELTEIEGSGIKIPALSRVALVCTLKEFHETGDHYLYVCTVDEALGDPAKQALFAWNGYAQIRTAK